MTSSLSGKKYLIRCDLEGVSGVVDYAQVEPGLPEYPEAREWFMQEILALVQGLRTGGAGEIVIYDEHWNGRNLDVGRLPDGVIAISGKPPYRPDWAGGLDSTFAGMILHGLHSRAGSGALLHHSYEHDIAGLAVNGQTVGEIGLEAMIAGDWDVPTQWVIADSAGAQEARDLIPGVKTTETKQSQSATGAACRPLNEVLAEIRETACQLVENPPVVSPLRALSPLELRMDFHEGAFLNMLQTVVGDRMKSSNRLVLRGDSTVTALWAEYWQIKLECRKRLGLS